MMNYLTREEIIYINKSTIVSHGGQFIEPENLLNPGPLEYLIEAIESSMFGEELYPTIYAKGAIYMYNIISNHIFSDGNKRTGLGAAMTFFTLNGYRINKKLAKDAVYDFTIKVASGQSSLEECQAWFEEHVVVEYLA